MKIFSAFSLIELLITIAIIGILATIAIPSYNTYVNRTNVQLMINSAAAAQLAANDYFIQNKTLTGFSENPTSKISIINGKITITDNIGGSNISIYLTPTTTPNEPLKWTCSSDSTDRRILPSSCNSI